MRDLLRTTILNLAAWSRRKRITKLVMSDDPRPLKDEPDWLIGWGLMTYANRLQHPGALRFYRVCRDERNRREEVRELARALSQLADQHKPWVRVEVRIPSKALVHGTVKPLEAVSLPRGSILRNSFLTDAGRTRCYILDVPPNSRVVELHPDVKATIIGIGLPPEPMGEQRAPER